ncbi:hypothetical protein B0H14DRAFT_2614412 [Mycena olivaceomarginata]|nr:hypothetical protein B0H14DRAFT_2614412 [Mycena olivaceomarginata]
MGWDRGGLSDRPETSKEQRYIHQIRMDGAIKIAVTMVPELAALIHGDGVSYLEVKEVTGKPVRFKAFIQRETSLLHSLRHGGLPSFFPPSIPMFSFQFIVKLCQVHFERSTDVLVAVVGQKTVDYLNRFRGLSKPEDISNWHQFCKTHENKKLRGFWQHTPSHTNLVESAHVATNRATTINLLPVEAVRTARKYDFEKAASIAAALDSCIMQHAPPNGSLIAKNTMKLELAAATEHRKSLAAQLKELKSQKKELGRVPRHSTSGRTVQSTSSIPQLVGTEGADGSRRLRHGNLPSGLCTDPSFDFLEFDSELDAPVPTPAPLGISNEDLLAFFAVPDFDANSFLQNNGLDLDAMGMMSFPDEFPLSEFPVASSPQAEWPCCCLYLPLLPSSHRQSFPLYHRHPDPRHANVGNRWTRQTSLTSAVLETRVRSS